MSNEEKNDKENLIKRIEELEKSIKPDLEQRRDIGKKEWTNESKEETSYRPTKDEIGTPPAGDDTE